MGKRRWLQHCLSFRLRFVFHGQTKLSPSLLTTNTIDFRFSTFKIIVVLRINLWKHFGNRVRTSTIRMVCRRQKLKFKIGIFIARSNHTNNITKSINFCAHTRISDCILAVSKSSSSNSVFPTTTTTSTSSISSSLRTRTRRKTAKNNTMFLLRLVIQLVFPLVVGLVGVVFTCACLFFFGFRRKIR